MQQPIARPLGGESGKIRLCLLIRGLKGGGAARQLVELCKGLNKTRFDLTVIVFRGGGVLQRELESAAGVDVVDLKKKGRWDVVVFLSRLVARVRRAKPHVIYSFLADSNLLAVLLKFCLGRLRVMWGIADAGQDLGASPWLSRLVYWAQGPVSRFADLVIANSQAGCRHYGSRGFPQSRMRVVPNGFDTERFRPTDDGRRLRAEWEVGSEEALIGIAGRLRPVKDHSLFLQAAGLLLATRKNTRFVCVGDGSPAYRAELEGLSRSLGVEENLIWAGQRSDMTAVYSALDLCTSSSKSEGLPNVLGEAMACGVPCVATDVGDAAILVGETGLVVRPGDPRALADGWDTMLEQLESDGPRIRARARSRIVSLFGQATFVERKSELIEGLLLR